LIKHGFTPVKGRCEQQLRSRKPIILPKDGQDSGDSTRQ